MSKETVGNKDEKVKKPIELGRRRFLDYLLGTSALATMGAIFYPIFRFMVPPTIVEAQQNSVVAAKTSEIAVNSGKIFKFGSKPGIIIRTQAGELKAFSATCTHLDCLGVFGDKSVYKIGVSKPIFMPRT